MDSTKTVSDPVHGHITLHPLCVAIIDTPQFQRLRHIKQNGLVHYVYPGAVHNRFGHSLGVLYLAGSFLRQLRDRQPNLGITDLEILCIEIAGLCHDLGHGPLSHTWEMFIKSSHNVLWEHEVVSSNLFDYLVEVNGLLPLMSKWGIGEEQMNFIKKIIRGETKAAIQPQLTLQSELWHILFFICSDVNILTHKYMYYLSSGLYSKPKIFVSINNEESGLDVDKWDYFLRDSYHLGFQINFDYRWLMLFARVVDVDGYQQICFRDKEAANVYGMFRTRSYLHYTAYKHRVVTLIEQLVCEVLCEADGKIIDLNGEPVELSKWSMEAAEPRENGSDEFNLRMERFCTLTDEYVLYNIANSKLPVADRLNSIENGRTFKNAYRYVGSCWIPTQPLKEQVEEDFIRFISEVSADSVDMNLQNNFRDKILLQVLVIHWGKGEKNPVDSVLFYSKDQPDSAHHISQDSVSSLLPRIFQEIELRLFCSDGECFENVKRCFALYCPRAWGKDTFYK